MKGFFKRGLLIVLAACVIIPTDAAASYKQWRSSIKAAQEARVKRDFDKARSILEGMADDAAALGPASGAENAAALAEVLFEAGDYDGTIQVIDPALQKIGPSPTTKPLKVWRGLLLLEKASTIYQLRRYDEALVIAEESRDVLEYAAGKFHPALSILHAMIAKMYETKREYAKAEVSYKAALKLAESHQTVVVSEFTGPEETFYQYRSPDFAAGVLVNQVALGNLYQLQERYKEAEELYNKGLKSAERDYGKKGQATVIPLAARAQLFLKTNRRKNFEEDTQRIYEVAAKGPGIKPFAIYPLWLKLETEAKENNTLAVSQTAQKLATVFEVQNYNPKVMAEAAQDAATTGNKVDWSRAAQIQEAIRDAALAKFKDPARTAPILIEFALSAEAAQQTNLARAHYRAILQTTERASDKALYIAAAGKLADLAIAENKPADALPFYQKVSAGLREKYGDDSRVANAMDREAELLKQLGRTEEGAELAKKANAVRAKAMLKR